MVDTYKAQRDLEEDQRNNSGADSLKDQIKQQQKIVDDKKSAVEKLRQDLGLNLVPGTGGTEERIDQDLDTRKRDLLSAKEEANMRRVLKDKTKDLSDDQLVDTLAQLGRSDAQISGLRADAFKTESDIDNLLKAGFEENHPRVQALRAELDRKRQQITELIAGTRQAISIDADIAQSNVDLLTKEVDDLTKKSLELQTSHIAPYQEAVHDYERQQTVLEAYILHLKQVQVTSQLMQSPVRIISKG